LMLTYPGYDTPDGRTLPPHHTRFLDEIRRKLLSGQQIVIPEALLRTSLPEFRLPEPPPHEPWQIVVYDEEEAQRSEALYEAKKRGDLAATMAALLELSENYRRARREEAIRLAELERQRLEKERKAREERERKEAERQEMIRQHKAAREAEARKQLTAFRLKWQTFRLEFPLAAHLPDLAGDLVPMEQAGNWGLIMRCLRQKEEFMVTAEHLAPEYKALVDKLQFKIYLQTRFNTALTTIAVAIAQDPVATKKHSRLSHLKNEIVDQLSRYDRIDAAWNAALDITRKRLAFLKPGTRVYQDTDAAIQRLGVAIVNDPYAVGHNAALKAIDDLIGKEVEKPLKDEKKNEVYKALYNRFIASEPAAKLQPRRYKALTSYERALIRMIRNGQAADAAILPANARNVLWERKTHKFSGPFAPSFKVSSEVRAEYRLWQDTYRKDATTSVIGATTWYLTGERMASYGRADSDRILFFYVQHTSSNQYKYGVVTHMPMRHDKTAEKLHYFPDGFPDPPGPVV